MSSSPPCNAVLVTEFYDAKPSNLPGSVLITSGSERNAGSSQTVKPSQFDSRITITNLPMPTGRSPNYSFQAKVMSKADLFIFVVTTCDFQKYNLQECPRRVPSVCWIDNSNEEETIARWKVDEKNRLINLSQHSSKLLDQKCQPGTRFNSQVKSRLHWYSTPEKFPVKSLQKVKETIQRICGDQIEFFSCSSTSLKDLLVSGGEVSEEFTKEWERLLGKAVKLHEGRREDQPPADDKTGFVLDENENGFCLIKVF